jgi:hypothetical protein
MTRPLLVAPLVALLAAPPSPAADGPGSCVAKRSAQLDRAAALIRSPTDLQAWLARPRPASDPFAALSPPARARFLASLRFGPQGLASFQSADIQGELSAIEAWRLLALFGLQSTLVAMPVLAVHSPEDEEVEAWRRAVSPSGPP